MKERPNSASISSALSRARIALADWLPDVEPAKSAEEVYDEMRESSAPSVGFFFLLGLAGTIATFGLIADSAPAIIGAMIVAPLMAPIMSLSYGLATLDSRLVVTSIVTTSLGALLVVAIAYLNTQLVGMRVAGAEILSRTAPTMLDLGIALAAGGAAAFAYTHRRIANSIAGVAIAVALVPPLAVSGIGLALGPKAVTEKGVAVNVYGLFGDGAHIASNALVLFGTNLLGIVVVAMLVFVVQRYGRWKQALVTLPIIIAASLLLIQPLSESLYQLWVKNRALRLMVKLTEERPDLVRGHEKIDAITVSFENDVLHVLVEGVMPRTLVAGEAERVARVNRIRRILSEDIGEPAILEVEMIPVDVIRVRSHPGEAIESGRVAK